jgi:hypothetical protein
MSSEYVAEFRHYTLHSNILTCVESYYFVVTAKFWLCGKLGCPPSHINSSMSKWDSLLLTGYTYERGRENVCSNAIVAATTIEVLVVIPL